VFTIEDTMLDVLTRPSDPSNPLKQELMKQLDSGATLTIENDEFIIAIKSAHADQK
jgi:hypothetical protein